MKLVRTIVALSAIASSAAFAGEKKEHGTPNCEVKGKKVHVKDAAACEKKHGKFLEEAAAAAPAAAPAEAAPAAAPAAK
jgi:fructose-specific component phosphotransferase system IIB-like protein